MPRRRALTEKTCPRCEKTFQPERSSQTFCSKRCARIRDLPTKACATCGREFRKNPEYSYAVWAKIRHCSKKCAGNNRPRRYATCEQCGSEFATRAERVERFCSTECYGKHCRTERFPVAGRRHGLNFTARMRRELLVLADGRCARCGTTEELEFDHVQPLFQGGENTVANGQVLCRSCHREKTNAELRAAWSL